MPISIPNVRGNAQALAPVTRTVSYDTDIAQFQNGTEQRFVKRLALVSFGLPYNRITKSDKNALATFFANANGQFTTTLQLTLGTTVYSNLTVVSNDDAFSAIESPTTLYSTNLTLRQVVPGAVTAVGTGTFPTLNNGVMSQLPFTEASIVFNTTADMPTGERWSWAWYQAGLTGFPTRPLKRWVLNNPALSDSDLLVLEHYFNYCQGRYKHFSFTSPEDNTTYPNCRFDTDSLQINITIPNNNNVSFAICEFNV